MCEQVDMSATRYYQVLNVLIDRHEALAFDPLLGSGYGTSTISGSTSGRRDG